MDKNKAIIFTALSLILILVVSALIFVIKKYSFEKHHAGLNNSAVKGYSSQSEEDSEINTNLFSSNSNISVLSKLTSEKGVSHPVTINSTGDKSNTYSKEDKEMPILTMKKTAGGKIPILFGEPEGTYNYCPSLLQVDEGTIYAYYCSNKDYKVIRDHIIVRKGIKENGVIKWSDRQTALAPSAAGWDSMHTCDPDVISGNFNFSGDTYNHLMVYLGCATTDCTVNEIGIAFSKSPEGPWIKYKGNPVVNYDAATYGKYWGVGQAALISIDQKGKVLLFYTRGDKNGTRMVIRVCDFSNMSKPIIGEEIEVGTEGLTEIDGSHPVLNNADFSLDRKNMRLYLIRDRHPNGNDAPDFISSQLQIAYCDVGSDYLPKSKWTVFANISKEYTGYPKNHNACLVSDRYGYIPASGNIEAYFAISELGGDSLWTYRLCNIVAGKIY